MSISKRRTVTSTLMTVLVMIMVVTMMVPTMVTMMMDNTMTTLTFMVMMIIETLKWYNDQKNHFLFFFRSEGEWVYS